MYLSIIRIHVIEVKSGNSSGESIIWYLVATSINKMTYAHVHTYIGHIFASGLIGSSNWTPNVYCSMTSFAYTHTYVQTFMYIRTLAIHTYVRTWLIQWASSITNRLIKLLDARRFNTDNRR